MDFDPTLKSKNGLLDYDYDDKEAHKGKESVIDVNSVLIENSSYNCTECSYITRIAFNLRRHMFQTHGTRKGKSIFKCPNCDELFNTLRRLNCHRINCPPEVDKYKSASQKPNDAVFDRTETHDIYICPNCNEPYGSLRHLNLHRISCNGIFESVNENQECGAVSLKKETLLATMTSVECNSVETSSREVQISFSLNDAKPEAINKCEKPTELVTGNIVACGKCAEVFRESAEYKEHIKTCPCTVSTRKPISNKRQETDEKPEHPGKISAKRRSGNCDTGQSLLRENKAQKLDKKYDGDSFSCEICEKSFSAKGNLVIHIRNIHEFPSSYKCALCPKTFNYKVNMEDHILRVHTKFRPFTCDSCDFGAFRKFDLEAHLKKMKCGEVANQSRNKQNELISQEEFTCPLCETVCTNVTSFIRHVRNHGKITFKNQEPTNSVDCESNGGITAEIKGKKKMKTKQKTTDEGESWNKNPEVEIEKDIKTYLSSEIEKGNVLPECEEKLELEQNGNGLLEIHISEDKPRWKNHLEMRAALATALKALYQRTKLEENLEKYRCHLCSVTCLSDVALEGHMRRH